MPRSYRVVLSATLVLGVGCVTSDEVARVPDPSGAVDAVVLERNGGATTSFGYEVYVVSHGRRPGTGTLVADFYGATRSASAYGVNPRWAAGGALTVEYLAAQQATLRASEASVRGARVRVALRDSISDSTAPPGGMLFNLQGRLHDSPVP